MTEQSNNSLMAEERRQQSYTEENELQKQEDGAEKLKGIFVQKTVSINESQTLVWRRLKNFINVIIPESYLNSSYEWKM